MKFLQKGKKIDLHIHSTYSDGSDTVSEVIAMAVENDIGIISFTEHDLVSGVAEAIKLGEESGVKVIPGIEISTTFREKLIHILGYGIDIQNQELLDFLDRLAEHKKKHFKDEMARLNGEFEKAGRTAADPEKYLNKEDKYFSLPGFAFYLVEEAVFKEKDEAFKFLEGKLKTPIFPIDPGDACQIIKKAGGISSLAHPLASRVSLKTISDNYSDWEKIIGEFKESGLDAIEAYNSFGHNGEETRVAVEIAKKLNLLITAGSDWHGSFEKTGNNIKKFLPFYSGIFGDLKVPPEIADNLGKILLCN